MDTMVEHTYKQQPKLPSNATYNSPNMRTSSNWDSCMSFALLEESPLKSSFASQYCFPVFCFPVLLPEWMRPCLKSSFASQYCFPVFCFQVELPEWMRPYPKSNSASHESVDSKYLASQCCLLSARDPF